MENDEYSLSPEAKRIKRSRIIAAAMFTLLPVPLYFIFLAVLGSGQPQFSGPVNSAQSIWLTGFVHALFTLTFLIVASSDIKKCFAVLFSRIYYLFVDLRHNPSSALSVYRADIRMNGAGYAVYIFVLLYGALWFVIGLARFIEYIGI